MSASRRLSRAVTMTAGSAASGIASVSGTGLSHATSGPASSGDTAGSGSASYSPDGSTRRSRRDSAVRHALVAHRVQPGAHRGPALEAVVRAPGAQEGLLDEAIAVPRPTRASDNSARTARAGTAPCPGRTPRYPHQSHRPGRGRRRSRSAGLAPADTGATGPNGACPSGPRKPSAIASRAEASSSVANSGSRSPV